MNTITTQHGRVIEYNLRFRKGSGRKIMNDLKAVDFWLHQEAILETRFMKNEYLGALFLSMNPKKLTQCDKDMLNDYLFGIKEVMLHNSAENA
jgi:hypothetical protein